MQIRTAVVFIKFLSPSHYLPPEFTLGILVILILIKSPNHESLDHGHFIMVVLLLLREVFDFATEHTPHHVLLYAADLIVAELIHHLFKFAVCDEAYHWISIFHES